MYVAFNEVDFWVKLISATALFKELLDLFWRLEQCWAWNFKPAAMAFGNWMITALYIFGSGQLRGIINPSTFDKAFNDHKDIISYSNLPHLFNTSPWHVIGGKIDHWGLEWQEEAMNVLSNEFVYCPDHHHDHSTHRKLNLTICQRFLLGCSRRPGIRKERENNEQGATHAEMCNSVS